MHDNNLQDQAQVLVLRLGRTWVPLLGTKSILGCPYHNDYRIILPPNIPLKKLPVLLVSSTQYSYLSLLFSEPQKDLSQVPLIIVRILLLEEDTNLRAQLCLTSLYEWHEHLHAANKICLFSLLIPYELHHVSERWRGEPQRLEVKVSQKTEMDPRKGKSNIISHHLKGQRVAKRSCPRMRPGPSLSPLRLA